MKYLFLILLTCSCFLPGEDADFIRKREVIIKNYQDDKETFLKKEADRCLELAKKEKEEADKKRVFGECLKFTEQEITKGAEKVKMIKAKFRRLAERALKNEDTRQLKEEIEKMVGELK